MTVYMSGLKSHSRIPYTNVHTPYDGHITTYNPDIEAHDVAS